MRHGSRFVEGEENNGQFGACVATLLLTVIVVPVFMLATHVTPKVEEEIDVRSDATVAAASPCAEYRDAKHVRPATVAESVAAFPIISVRW